MSNQNKEFELQLNWIQQAANDVEQMRDSLSDVFYVSLAQFSDESDTLKRDAAANREGGIDPIGKALKHPSGLLREQVNTTITFDAVHQAFKKMAKQSYFFEQRLLKLKKQIMRYRVMGGSKQNRDNLRALNRQIRKMEQEQEALEKQLKNGYSEIGAYYQDLHAMMNRHHAAWDNLYQSYGVQLQQSLAPYLSEPLSQAELKRVFGRANPQQVRALLDRQGMSHVTDQHLDQQIGVAAQTNLYGVLLDRDLEKSTDLRQALSDILGPEDTNNKAELIDFLMRTSGDMNPAALPSERLGERLDPNAPLDAEWQAQKDLNDNSLELRARMEKIKISINKIKTENIQLVRDINDDGLIKNGKRYTELKKEFTTCEQQLAKNKQSVEKMIITRRLKLAKQNNLFTGDDKTTDKICALMSEGKVNESNLFHNRLEVTRKADPSLKEYSTDAGHLRSNHADEHASFYQKRQDILQRLSPDGAAPHVIKPSTEFAAPTEPPKSPKTGP